MTYFKVQFAFKDEVAWPIKKFLQDDHLHRALDSCVGGLTHNMVQKVTIDSAETIWVDGFSECNKDSDCESKRCTDGRCERLDEKEHQKFIVRSQDDDVSGEHSCLNDPLKPCIEVAMLIVDWNLEYAQLTQDALEDNDVFRSSLVC
jgi:hypothetical protein